MPTSVTSSTSGNEPHGAGGRPSAAAPRRADGAPATAAWRLAPPPR